MWQWTWHAGVEHGGLTVGGSVEWARAATWELIKKTGFNFDSSCHTAISTVHSRLVGDLVRRDRCLLGWPVPATRGVTPSNGEGCKAEGVRPHQQRGRRRAGHRTELRHRVVAAELQRHIVQQHRL